MTTDAMVSLRGDYVCGAYVEFAFARCFDCPFDDCTDANASSLQCPRRRAELAKLRIDGIIPEGYLVSEEVAHRLGISTRNLTAYLGRYPIPSIVHRVGKLRWRLFPVADVAAAVAERERG